MVSELLCTRSRVLTDPDQQRLIFAVRVCRYAMTVWIAFPRAAAFGVDQQRLIFAIAGSWTSTVYIEAPRAVRGDEGRPTACYLRGRAGSARRSAALDLRYESAETVSTDRLSASGPNVPTAPEGAPDPSVRFDGMNRRPASGSNAPCLPRSATPDLRCSESTPSSVTMVSTLVHSREGESLTLFTLTSST